MSSLRSLVINLIKQRYPSDGGQELQAAFKVVEDVLNNTKVISTSVIVHFREQIYKPVPDEKDGKLRYRRSPVFQSSWSDS